MRVPGKAIDWQIESLAHRKLPVSFPPRCRLYRYRLVALRPIPLGNVHLGCLCSGWLVAAPVTTRA